MTEKQHNEILQKIEDLSSQLLVSYIFILLLLVLIGALIIHN